MIGNGLATRLRPKSWCAAVIGARRAKVAGHSRSARDAREPTDRQRCSRHGFARGRFRRTMCPAIGAREAYAGPLYGAFRQPLAALRRNCRAQALAVARPDVAGVEADDRTRHYNVAIL